MFFSLLLTNTSAICYIQDLLYNIDADPFSHGYNAVSVEMSLTSCHWLDYFHKERDDSTHQGNFSWQPFQGMQTYPSTY